MTVRTLSRRTRRMALLLTFAMGAVPALAAGCRLEAPAELELGRYSPDNPPTAVTRSLRVWGVDGCQATVQVEGLENDGRLRLAPAAGPGGLGVGVSALPLGGQPVPAAPVAWASVVLPAGQVRSLPLWLVPDAAQWLPPGTYRQSIVVRLLDSAGLTLDALQLSVSADIQATARAEFSGGAAGRVARLDFGQLQQGARRAAALDVTANTPHRVTLESASGARLVNLREPDSTPIPWSLRVNGSRVDLSRPASLPFTAQGRVRHTFEAEIGAVERVLAGDYADDLRITITAQ